MPNYNAYNAGLQGFMTGRKFAREDRQYQQETEGRSGLGQLLKQDYEKENPGSTVPNFGNMDINSQIAIVNYAKQKRKEIDEKEKMELSKGIEILKLGTEAASKSKGDVQKHLTKQAWGAALPILQKHGYFKDFDIAELDKKLNMADDKTISSFIKRTSAVSEALEAKTISTAEANKMTNQILVETIESIEDPNERKPVTDEITRIRKELEPEKEKNNEMDLIDRALKGDIHAKAILDERDKRNVGKAVRIETGKFGAQTGMVDDTTKEQIYQYYKKTGKYPPEFNRLFRIPGAQMEIIGYVSDKSKLDDITGEDRAETEINWKTLEKASQTANNPTFQRMIKAGKILIEGSTDPKTGAKNEAELDKIIRLRNEIPDALFGQISNKLRMFNSWDQFVNYQVSDPKMAELKGTVVANAERLGAIYSGGGTVTSDQKIKLALDLLDVKLGKKGFSQLVNSHKDSIQNTIGEYQTIAPVSPYAGNQVNQQQAKPTAKKPLSAY